MKIIEKNYGNGIELAVYDTKKFKTDNIIFLYRLPSSEENFVRAKLLSAVISRGTAKRDTLAKINRHLSYLYDASLDCSASKGSVGDIVFRISASMLDNALSLDGTDVFGGVTDFIEEMLNEPLVKDGKMNFEYVESEKRHLIEAINAEKNNKDSYTSIRATQIAYEGTPFAIHSTPEQVEAVKAEELYMLLGYITDSCPLTVVFGGNYTEDKVKQLDSALKRLSKKREGAALEKTVSYTVPTFDKAKEVTESIFAKQGRMVLNFSIQASDKYAASVFNEIFGGSPVSRLFMNVRERLSLCYYCSSSYNAALSRIIVRSGIDIENKEKAIAEINRQISLLSDSKNISSEELETAKKFIISSYRAVLDNVPAYCDWYLRRRMLGEDADIDECVEKISGVTSSDVAAVAKSMLLQLSYFLDGTDK